MGASEPDYRPESPRVVALYGPTGVGKTAVATNLARALGVRIISCDSMQLYRGFPVLTNQPSPEEMASATHALVGIADPSEEWTVALYAEHARPLIDEDVALCGHALVAGGTGLYLRAALAPLAVPNVYDPDLRRRLNERAAKEGSEAMYAELVRLDPPAAEGIHRHNLRRVVRALEVVLSEGPGSWSGRSDLWEPHYRHPSLVVGLTLERPELHRRIDLRSRRMLEEGAIEEVRRDLQVRGGLGPPADQPDASMRVDVQAPGTGVQQAIGYREIGRYLAGEVTLEQAADLLSAATRRYARAQLTWLRKLKGAVIMDASPGPEAVADAMLQLIKEPRAGEQ